MALAVLNTLSNQLPFSGGLIAKGIYLRKKHELAFSSYVGATIALYMCNICANGFVGLGALIYSVFDGDSIPTILVFIYLSMIVSFLFIFIPLKEEWIPQRLKERSSNLMNGWRLLKNNQSLIFQMMGLQILLSCFAAARLWFSFHALSQEVMLSHCLLFSSASIFTRLLNISPGGFGIREAIVASVASMIGFEFGISVVAVSLERLISLPVNIGLGGIFSYMLGKQRTR